MKFSIVVPMYNSEKYISNCIESVINQTYTSWELILVDDGSSDSTQQICEKYANENKNKIKLITQKNSGPFAARLNGAKQSSGDYILFLDSDDYYKECLLQQIFENGKYKNFDIFQFNFYKNNKLNDSKVNNIKFMGNSDNPVYEMFAKNVSFYIYDKCFKASIVKSTNFNIDLEYGNFGEDCLMVYLIAKNSKSLCIINDALYYYNFNNVTSISHNISYNSYLYKFNVINFIYKNEVHLKKSKLVRSHISSYFISFLLFAATQKTK